MSIGERRSEFVTVIAWIFILLTGFSTVVLLAQNIVFRTMFSGEVGRSMMQNMGHAPPFARFMFGNMDVLFLGILLISLLAFITSIALLKRKNWARLLFIVFLVIGVLWNVGGLVLQFTIFSDMAAFHNANMPQQFTSMMTAMRLMASFIGIAFVVLFLWMIKKLVSRDVKEEFRSS